MMINFAKKLARKSNHRTHRHATIILKGGRIIGTGYNKDEVHAEMNAILDMHTTDKHNYRHSIVGSGRLVYLNGSFFINVMITRSGRMGKSRPCRDCWAVMKNTKVRKVLYYDGRKWVTERVV